MSKKKRDELQRKSIKIKLRQVGQLNQLIQRFERIQKIQGVNDHKLAKKINILKTRRDGLKSEIKKILLPGKRKARAPLATATATHEAIKQPVESGVGSGSCGSAATVDIPKAAASSHIDPVYKDLTDKLCKEKPELAKFYDENPPQTKTIRHDGKDMQVTQYHFDSKETGQEFHDAMKNAHPEQAELFDKLNPQFASPGTDKKDAPEVTRRAERMAGHRAEPPTSTVPRAGGPGK